jgi:mono/diheme cytochrome c family protein
MKSKWYIIFVKAIFAIPLFLFGLWLLQMLYTPGLEAKKHGESLKPVKEEGIFRKILKNDERKPQPHFHMVDEHLDQPEPYQPICISCHGTFPHSKEKKVRSLLNFHTGFMACAVCHFRKDPADETFSFVWVDRVTGTTSRQANGEYGKYPAKIFPTKVTAENAEMIIHPVSEKSAREFMELKDQYTPDQVAQAKIKLHEKISQKPVFCIDCHKKDGYLNFKNLGFSKNRVNHLVSSEVASMIGNYETFYLPEVIDFGKN